MIAAFALSLAVATPAPAESEASRDRLMTWIEGRIVMPRGAAPLASYERLYAADETNDDIIAFYQRRANPGRRWVDADDFPMILDGGCAFIDVRVSLDPQVPIRATCHGEA